MLTNGLLLGLMALVLLWVVVAAVFGPFDTASTLLTYFVFIAVTGLFGGVVAAIAELRPGRKEGFWWKPPSPKASALLINTVVVAFLFGIGVLTLLVVQAQGSMITVTGAILALLAAAGWGRHLQKRFSTPSLLPYGVSMFGAFLLILIAFAAMKAAGVRVP